MAQNTINKVGRQLTKFKKMFTTFIQTKGNIPNTQRTL